MFPELKDKTPAGVQAFFKEHMQQEISLEDAARYLGMGDIFSKVFNSDAPDVDFLDLVTNSTAEKPLYVTLPKQADKKARDMTYESIKMISESSFEKGVKSVHICIIDMGN